MAPQTVLEVADAMRGAAAAGQVVLARGAGTKPGWAPPVAADVTLELGGLDRIVDHAAGDMVAQVQAGVAMRDLAAAVGAAGQQLAVDVPSYDDGTVLDAGTVGGALAVAVSGPRRLRYGRLRDLVLGVTMVRADGAVASAGGRVVKNVAGYDLGKLLTGSYGTLGLVVAATLRLHPLPAAVAYVTAQAPDAATGYAQAQAILDSQLVPSAVEVDRPGPGEPVALAALFEGTAEGVAVRAAGAAELVGGSVAEAPPVWFGRWPGSPSGTLVEATFLPSRLAEVLDTAAAGGPVRGSAGVARLHIGVPPDAGPAAVARLVAAVPGAVLRHAPPEVWAAVGPPPVDPGALALMRRVKDQFDPDHRLATPGWLLGPAGSVNR